MNLKIISGSLAVLGLVIVVSAVIVGWVVLPELIDNKIEKELKLVSGSDIWEKWVNVTNTIHLKVYIYHVTNPEQVETDGAYPVFAEKGPFVYNEKRVKNDISEKSGSVFYRQRTIYIFNRDDSVGDETEAFDIINIAFLSFISGVHKTHPEAVSTYANLFYRSGERVIRRNVTVKDLMFDGFDVTLYTESTLVGDRVPESFRGGRFGLYRGRNDTDDGYYQIISGAHSSSQLGEIVEWNHKIDLGYWNHEVSSICDAISGTDGSIFPPFVEKSSRLKTFVPEVCRSLYLTYSGQTETFGIDTYRFAIPEEVFQDPRENAENACFCMQDDRDKCDSNGVLDVTTCRGGPIVMSTAHFLDGDVKYQNASALLPKREMHETFMDIEPNSGVLLRASKRLQINVRLVPYEDSYVFGHLPEMIFPLIWVDEMMNTSQSTVDDLNDKFLNPIKTIGKVKWSVLGVGIFLSLAGTISFFVFRRESAFV